MEHLTGVATRSSPPHTTPCPTPHRASHHERRCRTLNLQVRESFTHVTTGHWPIAVARSYDGLPWEALQYSGEADAGRVLIGNCSPDACTLTLQAARGYSYRLEVRRPSVERTASGSVVTDRRAARDRAAAKLLLSGTFGPKGADIAKLSHRLESAPEGNVAEAWIREQMALSPTLHRTVFRRRANTRVNPPHLRNEEERFIGEAQGAALDERKEFVGQAQAMQVGDGRGACELYSRWHRYALTMFDVGRQATVSRGPDGIRSLHIDGRLRTLLPAIESSTGADAARNADGPGSSFDPGNALGVSEATPWSGYVCRVMERIGLPPASRSVYTAGFGGGVDLNPAIACRRAANIRVSNPPLQLDAIAVDHATTLLPSDSDAELTGLPWIGRASNLLHWGSVPGGVTLGGPSSELMAKVILRPNPRLTLSCTLRLTMPPPLTPR